jgi:DNA-directed RNA polymerase specialized sigma24 family protein
VDCEVVRMTPRDMLALAKELARRFGPPEHADDLASVACLGMLEASLRSGKDVALMTTVGHRRIVDELRRNKFRVVISIHHAVTELIDEWKRAPVQEDAAIVSEVRRIASKALTPPQLDVVMSRAREETHRRIAVRRRWSIGKAVKLEQDGMAALADAVLDDD